MNSVLPVQHFHRGLEKDEEMNRGVQLLIVRLNAQELNNSECLGSVFTPHYCYEFWPRPDVGCSTILRRVAMPTASSWAKLAFVTGQVIGTV